MQQTYDLIISDITLGPDSSDSEAVSEAKKRIKSIGLRAECTELSVYRCSVDARRKNNVRLVYSVLCTMRGAAPDKDTLSGLHAAFPAAPRKVEELPTPKKSEHSPVIVGMGPAGIFAALVLAKCGMEPVLIERGDDVRKRIRRRDHFYKTGELDLESNIQFGAGGAGTFSDGKLVTRVNDPRCSLVLSELARLGAPADILRRARPHVGTDLLPDIIENAAEEIRSLGGKVLYRTRLEGFETKNGRITAVKTQNGSIPCSACVLATGHSARDVYAMLDGYGVAREPKPFSVGVRIEHLTDDIDRAMYGSLAGHSALGHAEYNLSYRVNGRGVYTFCMCPGGEVVCGSTEAGGVVTNGMSPYMRDGRNSNSAVAVSVNPEDVGGTVEKAIEFQRMLERRAYELGGGGFTAPITTVGDFLNHRAHTKPSTVQPTYMGGNVKTADFGELFPAFVLDSLRGGIKAFGRTLSGFDSDSAVLTGAETRTSAPLRILRNAESLTTLGFDNLYPCGEGAGYAGGITSAAVDGIRVAEKIVERAADGAL